MHPLTFSLYLEVRLEDRVRVTVSLEPLQPEVEIDSVAVQLQNSRGEPLGPSLLLPISGALHGPLVSSVEVRSSGDIPASSLVIGTLWHRGTAIEARCPADPGPALLNHILGKTAARPTERGHVLETLTCDERATVQRWLPWISHCPRREDGVLDTEEVDTPEAQEEDLDDLCAEFDLDDEDAALLKEILGE